MVKCSPATLEERERAIFRSRRMFQSDQDSNVATAEYRAKLEVAQNLLEMNLSLDQIVKATGLTIKQVEDLRVKI